MKSELDQQALKEWLATRPKIIRDLAKRFPPGSTIEYAGKSLYVVSYDEGGALGVSETDPAVDYQKAVDTRQVVCADCVAGLEHVHA